MRKGRELWKRKLSFLCSIVGNLCTIIYCGQIGNYDTLQMWLYLVTASAATWKDFRRGHFGKKQFTLLWYYHMLRRYHCQTHSATWISSTIPHFIIFQAKVCRTFLLTRGDTALNRITMRMIQKSFRCPALLQNIENFNSFDLNLTSDRFLFSPTRDWYFPYKSDWRILLSIVRILFCSFKWRFFRTSSVVSIEFVMKNPKEISDNHKGFDQLWRWSRKTKSSCWMSCDSQVIYKMSKSQ